MTPESSSHEVYSGVNPAFVPEVIKDRISKALSLIADSGGTTLSVTKVPDDERTPQTDSEGNRVEERCILMGDDRLRLRYHASGEKEFEISFSASAANPDTARKVIEVLVGGWHGWQSLAVPGRTPTNEPHPVTEVLKRIEVVTPSLAECGLPPLSPERKSFSSGGFIAHLDKAEACNESYTVHISHIDPEGKESTWLMVLNDDLRELMSNLSWANNQLQEEDVATLEHHGKRLGIRVKSGGYSRPPQAELLKLEEGFWDKVGTNFDAEQLAHLITVVKRAREGQV